MNFDYTDDQQAIKSTAHEFLAARFKPEKLRELAESGEYDDAVWREMAELGWPGIFVEERHGGQSLGQVELTIVQEELGYALAPTPFFSNACAGLLLAAAGSDEQRERWLRPLAAGEARGTLAQLDEGAPMEPTGSSLTGTKIAVADAGSADFLVVAVGEGRHFVVETGGEGVRIEPTRGLDPTRKLFAVHLHGAEGHQLEQDPDATDRAYCTMAVALAAESTGVAQRALDMAVEYAKDRKQFDRPIGAYQAISHRCAQMLLEVEGARSVSYYAAWALDHEPESGALAAAMAKAYASDAGWRVPASSLQVHGGIGFTWEHDLHFFLKRGRANAAALGDARFHRERVAELAGV